MSDSMEVSRFISLYMDRLTENIKQHANENMRLVDVQYYDEYELDDELSQEITGVPAAYSAIAGAPEVLVQFAEDYARVGIDQYDDLCKEALLDFLNLINGLFIVYLSKNNISELSLNAPTKSHRVRLKAGKDGKIAAIPVEFSYGTVTFILVEPPGATEFQ